MPLALDPVVFDDALADVRRAADALQRDRRSSAADVDELARGWSGRAANSFLAGWSDWCSAADEVVDALTEITASMAAARVAVLTADGDADRSLSGLAARLG